MNTSKRVLATTLAAGLLGLAAQAPSTTAAEAATGKWFVLRQQNSFQCWTARVIQVSGEYATGTALIASGPFDSEEEAKQRLAELADRGTCRRS